MSDKIPMSAKEMALIKAIRALPSQEIVVKLKDSDIISVERLSYIVNKEGNTVIKAEKRERLFPV